MAFDYKSVLPGPKQADKYSHVGPAYNYYGEQPGWLYYPPTDSYVQDPNYQTQWAQQFGVAEKPPEKPSMWDQYGPLVGAAAGVGLGTGFAKDPGAFVGGVKDAIGGIGDAVGGLFGGGGAQVAQQATGGGALDSLPSLGSILGGGGSLGGTAPSMPSVVGTSMAPSIGAAPGAATPITGGGFLSTALPVAGIAAGGYGLYDLLSDRESSDIKAAGQGVASGAAMGASIGSIVPGIGTAIGGAVGGAVGGLIGIATSLFGDRDRWKTEKNKLNKLQEDGVFVPENLIASMPTSGRKLDTLIDKNQAPDFVGFDSNGNWVNNRFANSRDEKDLVAEDIVNYSAFAENDKDWFHKPLDQRLSIANAALQAGAVKEGHGSIKVDFKKFNLGNIAQYAPRPGNPTLAAMQAQAPQVAQPQTPTPAQAPSPQAPAPQLPQGPKVGDMRPSYRPPETNQALPQIPSVQPRGGQQLPLPQVPQPRVAPRPMPKPQQQPKPQPTSKLSNLYGRRGQ